METNISLNELEKSAGLFLEQIRAIKLANLQNVDDLKSQIATQQLEFENLSENYTSLHGKFEEAKHTIEQMEAEREGLNESIEEMQNENKNQMESILLLEKENKQLLANQQEFIEALKKISDYPTDNINASQNSQNETHTVLEHLQTEVRKWKSGQEELGRTKKLLSEIGKYFQNNSASLSTDNDNSASAHGSNENGQLVDTKSELSTNTSVKELPRENPTNFAETHASPSSNTEHSDTMDSQATSERTNVRSRKQLTPFVKTRKCHGRVKDSHQFRCLCGFTYKSRIGLHVHVRKMTQRWEHNCSSCGQYFFYASELQKHWNTSNCSRNRVQSFEDDPQDLSLGRRQLVTKSKLITPRLKQLQKSKYKTGIWNSRAFHTSRATFRRRKTGSNNSANWKFNCQVCHSRFQYLAYLKKHMAGTHNSPDYLKEYVRGCQICGNMFATNQQYWKHRATVHNLKRKSTDKPLTPKHEPVELEGPSTEPESQMPALVSMAAHSSREIVPTKRIMIERYLKDQAHLKTVHGPLDSASLDNNGYGGNNSRHFKCQCGKVYLSRTALMHHVKSMKYGMVFKCLRCSRGFTQLVNLQSHMSAMHHEDCIEFACGSCDKIFWKRKDFRLHCQEEHDTNFE